MIYTKKEETFLRFYKKHRTASSTDEIKLIFGVRLFLMDAKKMIIIYFLAFMLGIPTELLLVQIGFITFRQVAFGLHFGSSRSCLIASIIIFLGGTYFFSNLGLSNEILYSLFFCCTFFLSLLAPIGSKKMKIRGIQHLRYLRRKMYMRFLVMFFILIVLPLNISKYLVFGMLIETIVICYSFLIVKRGKLECINF